MTEEITGLLGAINRLAERVRLLEEIENFVGNDVIAPAYAAPIGTVHWDSNLRQLWGNFDGTAIGWQLIGGGGVAAHNLLNGGVHPDTVAQGATRGSLVYGNATPAWDELVHPGADRLLTTDANDVLWSTWALVGTAAQTYTLPSTSSTLQGGTGVSPQVAHWAATANVLIGASTFTYQTAASPNLFVQSANAAHSAVAFRAAAGQTATITQWQSSAGAALAVINNLGSFVNSVVTTAEGAASVDSLNTANNTVNRSYMYGVYGQLNYNNTGRISNGAAVHGYALITGVSPGTGDTAAIRGVAQSNRAATNLLGLDIDVIANGVAVTTGYGARLQIRVIGGSYTTIYGLRVEDVSSAVNNFAILTNAGNVVLNEGADANTDVRIEGGTVPYLFFTDGGTNRVGIGKSVPDVRLHNYLSSAATNTITDIVKIEHESTGTPAAGFGAGLRYSLESSTTANQDAAQISALWQDATHAQRSAVLTFDVVSNTSELEFLRLSGDSGGRPESVFNEAGADIDFRVETLVGTNSLFVQGSSGWTALGSASPNMKLTIYEVETLNGNLADGYAAGVQLDPGYTAGFTVTRHNYIDVNDVSTAGGAAVTNAAVMRFDAAFGTHKATTASFSTTDSNGDTTAWAGGIIVNVNGTLYKLPAIAV